MWQWPFVEQKVAPVLAHNDLTRVRRVLDVGCGPGTNAERFSHTGYLGIDVNERYIRYARQRHRRDFVVADARKYTAAPEDRFDFILVNSFLHHLDTKDAERILLHLRTLLTEDGHIHILELALPRDRSIARLLTRCDRGRFPRPLAEWQQMFAGFFEQFVFEPYTVTGGGMTLWHMVYFKGRARA
jgi:SAM-dependent methyltransferase